jgi:NTE family protein
MKKGLGAALIGIVLAGRATPAQRPGPAACSSRDSLALVLSGGAAHGLAHVGVLEVLDSLGVRPSLVVGTSMGAIIGAMYAGGMSGREIDSVIRRLPLDELFRRSPALTLIAAGDLQSPVVSFAPAFVIEQRGGTLRLQSPAARERQINALLDELLIGPNIAAGGDFSRLPIPFVAVATDIHTRAPVAIDRGDLAQAVRASASIPVVFSPVTRDEQLLIDGGLSSNVPVGAARARGASHLIVSDVGEPVTQVSDVQSTTGMIAYLLDFLFDQGTYVLAREDIAIRPKVDAFRLLNFSHDAIGPLIGAGADAARSAMQGCTAVASSPRRARPGLPDERRIADRLARLLDEGAYESVWLRPRRAADSALVFSPVASVAPGRIVGVGLGYDNHEGVHAWLASANTTLWDGRLSANGALAVGEWRQGLLLSMSGLRRHPLHAPNAALSGGLSELLPDPRSDAPPWSMLTRDLLRPTVSITASHETVRLYDEAGHEIARPSTRDFIGMVGMTALFAGGWQGLLAPLVHVWRADTLDASGAEDAMGGVLRVARVFPQRTSGPDQSSVPAVSGELLWTDRYERAVASADIITEVTGFQLRTRVSLGAGRQLPLSALLRLGGSLGFPGLMPDERLGEHVGFASVSVSHELLGPVHAVVQLGRGYAQSGHVMPNPWVTGGEIGLASDTPIGPLTISYGVATVASRVFKLRIGT